MSQTSQRGFAVIAVAVAVVVLAAIAGGGYYVYHKNHSTADNKSSNNNHVALKTGHPWNTWPSATLPHAKVSFKVPRAWTVKDESSPIATVKNGSSLPTTVINDQFTTTAKNGFSVEVEAENTDHPSGDGPVHVLYAQPVTFLGKDGYLDYYSKVMIV